MIQDIARIKMDGKNFLCIVMHYTGETDIRENFMKEIEVNLVLRGILISWQKKSLQVSETGAKANRKGDTHVVIIEDWRGS